MTSAALALPLLFATSLSAHLPVPAASSVAQALSLRSAAAAPEMKLKGRAGFAKKARRAAENAYVPTAKAANTEAKRSKFVDVLLSEPVPGVGEAGETVTVKASFADNVLTARGKGTVVGRGGSR